MNFGLGSYKAAAPEIYYWSATHRMFTATQANCNVGYCTTQEFYSAKYAYETCCGASQST